MKRGVKIGIVVFLIILVGVFIAYFINMQNTKSHSPEATVLYDAGEVTMEVFYNRPYKKGREIFGGLVPYGEVWRTGANEATTFSTNSDITVEGKFLAAGKYTLWTIPGERTWKVIFNDKQYSWGVKWGGKPSREPEHDVLEVEVPVRTLDEVVEQFTIAFVERPGTELVLRWDRTEVGVGLSR